MASKAWLEFERVRGIKERKHLPKVLRSLKNQFKFFADLYTSGGDIHTALPIEELSAVIQNLYRDTGKRFAFSQARELTEGLKLNGFGASETWVQAIIDYFRTYLLEKAVLPITNTTRRIVLEVIEQGTQEGWGAEKTAAEIMKRGAEMNRNRARVITRTETVRAANLGKWTAARDFKFETNKVWRSAGDRRVRPQIRGGGINPDGANHVVLNGTQTGLNDQFKNGLQFPGDPNAPAKETVNCRCTMTFKTLRDANGNPIPIRYNANIQTLTNANSLISVGLMP